MLQSLSSLLALSNVLSNKGNSSRFLSCIILGNNVPIYAFMLSWKIVCDTHALTLS